MAPRHTVIELLESQEFTSSGHFMLSFFRFHFEDAIPTTGMALGLIDAYKDKAIDALNDPPDLNQAVAGLMWKYFSESSEGIRNPERIAANLRFILKQRDLRKNLRDLEPLLMAEYRALQNGKKPVAIWSPV